MKALRDHREPEKTSIAKCAVPVESHGILNVDGDGPTIIGRTRRSRAQARADYRRHDPGAARGAPGARPCGGRPTCARDAFQAGRRVAGFDALGDRDQARDLIFCLGASEVVAAEISQAGSNWLDIFDAARTATAASLLTEIRCHLD